MVLKFCFIFIPTLFLSLFGIAQSDSTDLNFYSTEPEMQLANDSTFFLPVDLVELRLEFGLDDSTVSIGKVWIELILLPPNANPILLSHSSYTFEQLEEQDLIHNNVVTVSFGFYSGEANYEVSVTIEDLDGNTVRSITKRIVQ